MSPLVRALGTITAALLSLQTLAPNHAVLGGDAHPAQRAQQHTVFAEKTEPAVSLLVAPETPLVSDSDASVSFTVRITNEGERETDPQTLALEMETARLTTATRDTPFGENGSAGATTKPLAETRIPAIGPDETHEEKVTVSAATLNPGITAAHPVPADGVYRLRATLNTSSGSSGSGSNVSGSADSEGGTDASSGEGSNTAGSNSESSSAESGGGSGGSNAATDSNTAANSNAAAATASGTTSIVWQSNPAPATPAASAATTLDDGSSATINPVQLAVIVPITLPTEITQLPTTAELGEIAAAGGPLDRLLTAAEQSQATLAIDPRLIVAIRGYGENAPDSAKNLLQRLETTALQSFLLQFNDADLGTQAALGYTIPIQPQNFLELTAAGDFNATPPSDSELSAWHETAGKIAWPAAGSLTPETVKLAGNAGHTRLISDSDAVTVNGGPRGTLTVDDAPFEVLVADSDIAEAAAKISAAGSPLDTQAATAELTSLLALAGGTTVGGSASTLITLDRASLADAADPETVLQTLLSLNWAQPTTTEQLVEGTVALAAASEPTSSGGEGSNAETADNWRSNRLEQLQERLAKTPEINTRASVLEQPELLTAAWQLEQLQLLNAGAAGSESAHKQALKHTDDWLHQMLHGIKLVSASRTQLIGSSSQIPLQIKNSLPYRATVKIELTLGSSALLPAQTSYDSVSLQPNGTSTVLVPVQSRIASGTASIVIDVTDTTGQIAITTKTLTISITSFVETVSIVVVSVAAVLFIGFGIVRSARRKRLQNDTKHNSNVE